MLHWNYRYAAKKAKQKTKQGCFKQHILILPKNNKKTWFQSHPTNNTNTESFTGDVKQVSSTASFFKLPFLSAHGALLLHLLGVQPFQDAVHVKAVGALAPDQRAVVPRYFTCKEYHKFTFLSRCCSTEMTYTHTHVQQSQVVSSLHS